MHSSAATRFGSEPWGYVISIGDFLFGGSMFMFVVLKTGRWVTRTYL